MGPYKRFRDIPRYIQDGSYSVHCSLVYLETQLYSMYTPGADFGIPKETLRKFKVPIPDFQRGHVWNTTQRREFIEHMLKGGDAGIVRFNCPEWPTGRPLEIVDGLQRITACLLFIRDKLKVFDSLYSEFEGEPDLVRSRLMFQVNDLPNRREVLRWYLQLNAGGTPHTTSELNRVRKLLEDTPFRSIGQVQNEYLPSMARQSEHQSDRARKEKAQ